VATATSSVAAAGTTINKVDMNDDGIVVNTSGTKDMPTSGGATPAKAAAVKSGDVVEDDGAVVAGAAGATTMVSLGGMQWQTPTAGKIITPYSVALKGIDVSGKLGQPIVAAAAGKVVYSGNGLKGYGNLIIIKHGDNYLTAYSHNRINLVKEGDSVKQGQKIAELGSTESTKPMLHFELRKAGKPLNPSSIFAKP
jgi:lipoprotein NlpD